MDMTPEEFDAAAHQLLVAEAEGTLTGPLRLPGMGGVTGDPAWGDDDESVPLRGAPTQFQGPAGAGGPPAPSRRRGKPGPGGPTQEPSSQT